MSHSLRYAAYRMGRLPLFGAAAALARKGSGLLRGLAAEAGARLWGTEISDRALDAALRPDAGGRPALLRGDGTLQGAGFFLDAGDRDRLAERLRAEHPGAVAETIRAAEAICAHRFDLLGSGPTTLGAEMDWHRDFKSGCRWDPRTFYTRVRYGDIPGADVKVPWELSRFQHLATLGKAYWLTGHERYVGEYVAQVSHWITRNPPQFGVNWACTMDIAIRAFNWLWGYAFFGQARELTSSFRREFTRSLLAHGRHIMKNLERGAGGITSNHYLANLVGLAGLGCACPAFREAPVWRQFALDEIVREMQRQVHPDGGDYEASIPYHRLVAEMFLAVAILCGKNGIALPDAFRERLGRMLDFTLWYTKPSGLAPQVGDADDGRLHILADYGRWDPRDHRHLLATGGALLGRDDLWAAAAGQTEEAIWLHGGPPPTPHHSHPPSTGSRAFPETGIYLMREADLYLLIACGPVGTRGIGNHKHNDLLSFELHANGQDLLVDPGSFVYTPDPVWRNHFRSTAVHNTVMIDNEEQNRFGEGGLFWLHADATPRCLAWESKPDEDFFAGEHDGYARLTDPILHRREIRLRKRERSVEISDHLHGAGRHGLAWNFTLAPDVTLRPIDDSHWEVRGRSARALLTLEAIRSGVPSGAVRAEVAETVVAPRYGVKEKTSAIRLSLVATLPVQCHFRIELG